MNIVLPYPPKELNPNFKIHRARKAKFVKSYRNDCFYITKLAMACKPNPFMGNITLKIVFHPADHRKRDDDNMISAFKAGRDGIALALKIDDNIFKVEPSVGAPIKGGKVLVTLSSRE